MKVVKASTWHFCAGECGKKIEVGKKYINIHAYEKYHLKCLPEKYKLQDD